MSSNIVIIGGGIAATTCLETLFQGFDPNQPNCRHIILISANRLIKRATNYTSKGRNLEQFDVEEVDLKSFLDTRKPKKLEVSFVLGCARRIDSTNKTVSVDCDGTREVIYHYEILVICIGSSPSSLIVSGSDNPNVQQRLVTIRDTTSVRTLQQKLSSSRSVAIIGNGGISLELIYKISDCKKIWIVRDKFIGHPFLDPGASKFLLDSFGNITQSGSDAKELQYGPSESRRLEALGPALGPYWLQQHDLKGALDGENELEIIYQNKLNRICASEDRNQPLTLVLTSGRQIECDLIISAIGVSPNKIEVSDRSLRLSNADGGIIVDEQMRTSLPDIYAAGDVVSCEDWPSNPLWFQMRLWTQARQMGYYCGQCIISHLNKSDPAIYSNFECFTHCTDFLGKKIILLGQYNIQDENQVEKSGLEILLRTRTNLDYVKLVVRNDRIIGAILVGESGLDETIENLICDQIEIGAIKNNLLDETADIEDYFD